MNWISLITAAESILRTIFGSREKRDDAAASENTASMQQYAAEFAPRTAATWFDSLVDGVNRLQRPTYTFSTLGLFWMAYQNPAEFSRVMTGFSLIPEPFWVIVGMIVGFLFSSRMLEKLPVSSAFKGVSAEQARRTHEAAAAMMPEVQNPSITAWKKQLHNPPGDL